MDENDRNQNDKDPTKEAFFQDLMEMEEDISDEAYELVEHALSLIDSKYYDDAIEVLRQAIGLYSQINAEEEIQAINKKKEKLHPVFPGLMAPRCSKPSPFFFESSIPPPKR